MTTGALYLPQVRQMVDANGRVSREWLNFFITLSGLVAPSTAITGLTGDVTASGPGDVAATIASDVIVDSMVNSAAAIAWTKLASYAASTWTPTVTFGGASTGITYTRQVGAYREFNDWIWLTCRVTLSSKGTATGSANLEGLPVAVGATYRSNGESSYYTNFDVGVTGLGVRTIEGTSTLRFLKPAGGSAAAMVDTDFSNTSDFSVTVAYLRD